MLEIVFAAAIVAEFMWLKNLHNDVESYRQALDTNMKSFFARLKEMDDDMADLRVLAESVKLSVDNYKKAVSDLALRTGQEDRGLESRIEELSESVTQISENLSDSRIQMEAELTAILQMVLKKKKGGKRHAKKRS